eukprot:3005855-Prymnesium_polylepis.1
MVAAGFGALRPATRTRASWPLRWGIALGMRGALCWFTGYRLLWTTPRPEQPCDSSFSGHEHA